MLLEKWPGRGQVKVNLAQRRAVRQVVIKGPGRPDVPAAPGRNRGKLNRLQSCWMRLGRTEDTSFAASGAPFHYPE